MPSTDVVRGLSVAIPVIITLFVATVMKSASYLSVMAHSQQQTLAALVHAASRNGFAARQDSNPYMSLMDVCTAAAQLGAARQLASDADLERLTGIDIRHMTNSLEKQRRRVTRRLDS